MSEQHRCAAAQPKAQPKAQPAPLESSSGSSTPATCRPPPATCKSPSCNPRSVPDSHPDSP
eukprot:CAMPEP_0179947970 /NCGR_PEP_ID=MMETSP0983-20121128/21347_1 /TAXON_ID=483367 /ORGANISM="non described non described, Strain CCMP 2436" /LENGTH=60 /DNA_ID=CAMNT_0021857201 /DNA_START=454 /DNA_END=633 /DNA_ORIENTATION=+